jgi:Trk K+ transport system NAD-binding subunit
MYLIIVGSGPVGSSLIELALRDGQNVALIESNDSSLGRSAARQP